MRPATNFSNASGGIERVVARVRIRLEIADEGRQKSFRPLALMRRRRIKDDLLADRVQISTTGLSDSRRSARELCRGVVCAASTTFAGSDNYFCRRRVSKGVSPTTWRHSVIVVGRSVAVSDVSAEAPAGA
jgi:hypothetical protein